MTNLSRCCPLIIALLIALSIAAPTHTTYAQEPTPTDVPTSTPAPTDTATATATWTSIPTPTELPTLTETASPTASPTETAVPSETPTVTAIQDKIEPVVIFYEEGTVSSDSSLESFTFDAHTQDQFLDFVQDFQGNLPGPGEAIAPYTASSIPPPPSGQQVVRNCYAGLNMDIPPEAPPPSACVRFDGPGGTNTPLEVRVILQLGSDPNLVYRVTGAPSVFVTYSQEYLPEHIAETYFRDHNGNILAKSGCVMDTSFFFPPCNTVFEQQYPYTGYPVPGVRTVERVLRTNGSIDASTTSVYFLAQDTFRVKTDQVTDLSVTPTIEEQLAEYGVFVETEGNIEWTTTQLQALLTGVTHTAEALQTQAASGTAVEVFRRVMLDEANGLNRIVFVRSSSPGTSCTTNDVPNPPVMVIARITCYAGNQFSEFTAVHELGHVFIGRTNEQFHNSMDRARVFDGSDIVVFGLTQWLDSATGQRHDDWYRGQRGWGSDAPYFGVNDPAISTLGPCEYASNAPPPTSFQQNPCHVKNWLYAPNSTILVTEVEEAAADMFLNRVYRTLNITDGIGNMGFANVDWRFANNPPDNTNPGDIRFNWVNEVLPEIFAVQGW